MTKPSPSLSHSIVSLLSPTQPSATRKLDIDFEQKYEPDIRCVKDAANNSTISLNSNEDAPAAADGGSVVGRGGGCGCAGASAFSFNAEYDIDVGSGDLDLSGLPDAN